jgi:hypothetical protein
MNEPEPNESLPTDLSFASIDELITELMSRIDAGIVMLRTDTTQDDTSGDSAFKGDPFMCMGLADFIKDKILAMVCKMNYGENDEED